jgi:hypothetical protein
MIALDHAVLEMDLAAGVLGDVVFVGDQDDRLALRRAAAEEREDFLGGLRVEVARGLVGQEDAGLLTSARAMAPRAAADRPRARWGGASSARQADAGERVLRRQLPLLRRHAGVDHRQLDVLQRGRARAAG